MKRFRMPRRSFLRGALHGGLGISIGLPLLEVMLNDHGTALAQGLPLTKRFGTFFFGNGRGVEASKWRPDGTGTGWTPSVELAPLAGIRDYVSVVTGFDARLSNSPQGHHNGSAAILSGYDFITQPANNAPYRSTFARKSIDQLAADVLGADTPFRSLEIGLSERVIRGEGTTLQYISHNGPDSGNPAELNPQALFDRLFSGIAPVMPNDSVATALHALRASVLDTVVSDLGALKQRVSTADRARIDQHTESIRAIERRLSSTTPPSAQCADPSEPEELPDDDGREPFAERMAAMADLLALAMSCDLSRVFSIQVSGSAAGPVFWQVGATRGHHDLSHEGEAAQEVIEAATVFTMELLATLLQKLRDTPDGANNLLDSLALIATSDHSDGAAHSVDDLPILIAGRAGGSLVHPGIHYAGDGEHTNQVLLALMRSIGVELDELGEDVAHETSSLSALEA
jgi:hypothetical protein